MFTVYETYAFILFKVEDDLLLLDIVGRGFSPLSLYFQEAPLTHTKKYAHIHILACTPTMECTFS